MSLPAPFASDPRRAGAPSPPAITRLLQAVAEGDRGAFEQVLGVVYAELHSIAQARMGGERANHTLQPTALVNEAYLRLLGKEGVQWAGRAHFFRAAAEAMRKILIDHARARDAQKRGGGSGAKGVGGEGGDLAGQGAVLTANDRIAAGGRDALSIGSLADAANQDSSAILALDAAIVRLEEVDGQAAAVVRLKFFAGLPDEAVAEALEVSPRTVRRDWAFARGWLRDALERHGQQE